MPSQKWKDALNKTCLLFARTLEPEEIEVWEKFLEPLPQQATEYAFDNWQRNGRFFPKPKDILDLVEAYSLQNADQFKPCTICDMGWVRVFTEQTAGGNQVDSKLGAVRRCECFKAWVATQRAA